MRVVTFGSKEISDSARRLVGAVAASGTVPDIVIGIRTGGRYVADAIVGAFERMGSSPDYSEAFIQRSSTPWKKRLLSGILPLLPVSLLDRLRVIESRMLARNISSDVQLPEVMFSDEIACGKILVVDDAVDSGRTMKAVVESLVRLGIARDDISTAAITVTTVNPLIMPDFFIFNDKTLIRFPWSIDYRKS